MNRTSLISSLALGLLPALAQAGGELVTPPPPAPPPVPLPEAAAPAPAPAPVVESDAGPYVALFGGASWLDDSDVDVEGDFDTEIDFDTGWVIGGAAGYAFDYGVVQPRAELALAYSTNDIDGFTVDDLSASEVDGDVSAVSGMANVWLDLPVTANLKPYVGGGVGAAYVSVNDVSVEGIAIEDDEDFVFAWQLGAGAAYEFTPNFAVTLDYRWFNTSDPTFSDDGDDYDVEVSSHNVMAGIRYKF